MLAWGILILIVTAETIIAVFHPIQFPPEMMDWLTDYLSSVWIYEGVLPVAATMKGLTLIISILVAKFIFKLVMGFIAMGSGAGKPEID